MLLRNIKNKTLGMAFGGCSFTWGQHLWYYSNMDTVVEQPLNKYFIDQVTFANRAYAELNRFPRLVANHFNTFEMCQPFNGGSNSTVLQHWGEWAIKYDDNFDPSEIKISNQNVRGPIYHLSEIGAFVLQLTQWARTDMRVVIDGEDYGLMQRWKLFEEKQDLFYRYLSENKIDINRFIQNSIADDLANAHKFLLNLEYNKKSVYLLTWPEEFVPLILENPWLSSKLVKLHYKDKIYYSIEKLIDENPEMMIMGDYEYFEITPQDMHPSLKCHRVIADSIIKHIEDEHKKAEATYIPTVVDPPLPKPEVIIDDLIEKYEELLEEKVKAEVEEAKVEEAEEAEEKDQETLPAEEITITNSEEENPQPKRLGLKAFRNFKK